MSNWTEELGVGAVGDDEVGLEAGDRLDVGLESVQALHLGGRLLRDSWRSRRRRAPGHRRRSRRASRSPSARATRSATAPSPSAGAVVAALGCVGGAVVAAGAVVAGGGRGAGIGRLGSLGPASLPADSSSSPQAASDECQSGEHAGSEFACAWNSSTFGRTSGSPAARPAHRPCLEGLVVAHGAVDRARPDHVRNHRCGTAPGSHRTSHEPCRHDATPRCRAAGVDVARMLARVTTEHESSLPPTTRDPTVCGRRRRSCSSTPATARARARPRSA